MYRVRVVTGEHAILRDHFAAAARRFERKVFLDDGARSYSYRAVEEWTDRVASGLVRLGLRRGERIGLVVANRPEFVFLAWGATKVGGVPVPVDPALAPGEILASLARASVAFLAAEPRFEGIAAELARRLPGLRHTLLGADVGDERFQALVDGPVLAFWPDLDPGDPAAVLFDRANRGWSDPVVLSHRNLLANCRQLLQPLRIDSSDRFFAPLPLASAEGMVLGGLAPWMAGGTVVLGDVEGRTLAERVAEQGITVVVATPSVCRGLVSSPEGPPDGAALRLAVCLSGPVDRAVHLELERRYDALVVEGYGRVEATCAALANPYTGRRKPGSLGLPLPEESCRIVDHEGCDLAAGSTGEIVLRGPNIMSGYLDDPARSREALRDGWLHTGDSGHVDGDGYYYLAPRPIPCSG